MRKYFLKYKLIIHEGISFTVFIFKKEIIYLDIIIITKFPSH